MGRSEADALSPGTASEPTSRGPEPEDRSQVRYSVDELAAAAGLPVRTVRHYQSEKVLQPPQRRGRVAVYGLEHVDRLQLIARLQDRGLQLSAIRDALKRVAKGELWLDDWLGLGEQLRAPWSEDQPTVLSEDELTDRVGDRPGILAALSDARLVRRQPGLPPAYLVPSPGLLDITVQLEAAGIDITTASDAAAILRKHLRKASHDVVDHFLSRAGSGFARAGSTDDVAEALDALRPLGVKAVRLLFAQEIERALRDAVDTGRATPATPTRSNTGDDDSP
jgi:DNA-binding transcriptional MerR regulator